MMHARAAKCKMCDYRNGASYLEHGGLPCRLRSEPDVMSLMIGAYSQSVGKRRLGTAHVYSFLYNLESLSHVWNDQWMLILDDAASSLIESNGIFMIKTLVMHRVSK